MGGGSSASLLVPVLGGVAIAFYVIMVMPALDRRRWRFAMDFSQGGIVLGLISVAFLTVLFWPNIGFVILIVVAVMVHEYGHVLAYRLAGHRAPVFHLIPFGGLAMSNEPPKSQVERAYVSLMGPGFSLILVVAALLVAWALQSTDPMTAIMAYQAAGVVGMLNFFNLLPFYPLDGGHTVRAVASVGGAKTARTATVVMSAAFAAVALAFQLWFLLFFAVMGIAAAQQDERLDQIMRSMSPRHAMLTSAAYLATLAAHGFAALPFIYMILFSFGLMGPTGAGPIVAQ